MEEFLNYIFQNLAERPDEVFITHASVDGKEVFTVQVSEQDRPRIIGKRGQTIQAIRSLLNVSAAKHGTRARLILSDD